MRFVFRLLAVLGITGLLVIVALVGFGLSNKPDVPIGQPLSHRDIARARALLDTHDPRRLPAGARRNITLNEADLNLAANYLVKRHGDGGARVALRPGVADVDASLRLHPLSFRGVLNVSFSVEERDDHPRLTALRVGSIPIPDVLSGLAMRGLLALAQRYRGARMILASIRDLDLEQQYLRVNYEWQPELLNAVRDDLIPADQRAAMAAYHAQLAQLQRRGRIGRGSLTEILPPLFAFAESRSRDGDPAAENRALLAVLGAWSANRGMERLLSDMERPDKLVPFRVKLQGRLDFAQHFLISAALAANGDTTLSDAIGIYKEVRDSLGGSGFSFTDLAADRAGTRFGEVAGDSRKAARLQQLVAAGVAESDLMPPARDLPEHLQAGEFQRRFGDVDSPAYAELMEEIERRVQQLPLYR